MLTVSKPVICRDENKTMPPSPDEPPRSPLSRALWHFSPQWFLVPQGTGVLAIVLHQLHYQFHGLRIIAKIVWIYTIAVLGITLILYLLRCILYPRHVGREVRNNILETSCLSSISVTLTSIFEMIAMQYSDSASLAAYVLWWVTTGLAIIFLLATPYVQLKLQPPGLARIPPAILLPVIAALTSAAGGGGICMAASAHLSHRLCVPAVIVSFFEIGVGMPLAIAFTAVVLLEHYKRKSAPDKVYQDLIICGPFAQGGFALMALGEVVLNGSFADYDRGMFLSSKAATPVGYFSVFTGVLSWGFGTFWWLFGLISVVHTLVAQEGGIKKTKFTMTVWSVVFPWVCFLFPFSLSHCSSLLPTMIVANDIGCVCKFGHRVRKTHGVSSVLRVVYSVGDPHGSDYCYCHSTHHQRTDHWEGGGSGAWMADCAVGYERGCKPV